MFRFRPFRFQPGRAAALTTAAALLTLTAACGSSDSASSGDSGSTGAAGSEVTCTADASGDILVLTNRTDIVDTVFQDYKKTFEAKYPNVKVTFEALTDYEGEVKTRMSTKDYGDVLGIPASVAVKDLPDFFAPLGTTDDLGQKYRFVAQDAVDGTAYGLATFGNANGIVYNKKVFQEAGITDLPTTPDQYLADLQAVKDKTDAIPYYTNYKDGWPLGWPQNLLGSATGDKDALVKMAANDSPWAAGQEKAELDSLLYDSVQKGLSEDDPTTTNWENSKNLLATGKVGVMPLGSWALPQMQDAAKTAGTDPADIGFMPAPFQADGKFHAGVGPDFMLGINSNSEHKQAARCWVDWFVNDSGFSEYSGGLPTVKSQPAPADLKEFEATGVEYVELTPSPTLSAIDNQAEIGLTQPDYYRTLIDSARGASGQTKQQIFDDLNAKWAAARAATG
ncbi:MAG: extracellular solute-binding protein [Nakamurella sp.]